MNRLAIAALVIAAGYFGSKGDTDGPAILCVLFAGLLFFTRD